MLFSKSFVKSLPWFSFHRRFNMNAIKQKPLISPSIIHISVVGTGSYGKPQGVFIFTSGTRYLINCGDMVQLVLTDHIGASTKIDHVFITKHSWKNTSGLLGFCLTMNANNSGINFHGPPISAEITKLAAKLADSKWNDFVPSSILNTPFNDAAFTIKAIPIETGLPPDEPVAKKLCTVRDNVNMCIAYHFIPKNNLPQKIDTQKCLELGATKQQVNSKAMSDLLKGIPLPVSNGYCIQPAEVLFSIPPVRSFLVLECPSEDYVQSYLDNEYIKELMDENNEQCPQMIIHMTPADVIASPKYQKFINSFPQVTSPSSLSGTCHLLLDGSDTGVLSSSVYKMQAVKHSVLDHKIFPLLPDQICGPSIRSEVGQKEMKPRGSVVQGQPLLTYPMRPTQTSGFTVPEKSLINNVHFVKSKLSTTFMTTEEVDAKISEMKQRIEEVTKEQPSREDRPYPQVTFFGTGSSIPSKYRNVSCIALQIDSASNMILDCGEGALVQMIRMYGEERTKLYLMQLKVVLITHMHMDHHGGLYTILDARHKAFKEAGIEETPVTIFAPAALQRLGQNYDRLFNTSYFNLHECYSLNAYCNPDNELLPVPWIDQLTDSLKTAGVRVRPVFVPHTRASYGFVVEGGGTLQLPCDHGDTLENHSDPIEPWKVVYSGDTRPCQDLVKYGHGCDLLIHEATHEDKLHAQAVKKMHSTTGEALTIAKQMEAKFILLNHFSQRYNKIPVTTNYPDNAAPSFDFMQVTLNDLFVLPYTVPYYEYIFPDDWFQLVARTSKVIEQESIAS